MHAFADGNVTAVASCVGHRTIKAAVVATVLDLEERARALARAVGTEHLGAEFRRAGTRAKAKQLQGARDDERFLRRPENQANPFDFANLIRAELGAAACNHNFRLRIHAVHLAYEVARLGVRGGRHRAGVDQVNIGLFAPGHGLEACGEKAALVCGGLGVVQFAAESQESDFHNAKILKISIGLS